MSHNSHVPLARLVSTNTCSPPAMPASSQAALDRKRKRNADRGMLKRQSFQESRGNSVHIHLSRQYAITKNTDLAMFEGIPCQTVEAASSHSSSRSNITLVDRQSNEIILQRIAPSSYDKKLETKASAEHGKTLYDRYLAKKQPLYTIQTDSSRPHRLKITLNKRKVVEHHLGIWHSRGKYTLDLTKETSDTRYKQEALDLLGWTQAHAKLVMTTAQSCIDPSFKHNLKTRSHGRRWLASIFGAKTLELLHPWFTTVAFFSNFAGGIHLDTQDCIPSFLFNFSEAAWFELPEYSAKIQVEPLVLVALNSRTFYHRTKPLETTDSGAAGARWAFSGFFRQAIYDKEPMCKIAHNKLEALLEGQK